MTLLRNILKIGILDAFLWSRLSHGPVTAKAVQEMIQKCDNLMGRSMMRQHRSQYEELMGARWRLTLILKKLETGVPVWLF